MPDRRSLPAQLILSFFGVVILTAITIGLPAIGLIRAQLERQAWSQVERGRLATKAVYSAQLSHILDHANLAAQRPTFQQLLAQENRPALDEYLSTLQVGAGLDHIILCDLAKIFIPHPGGVFPADICTTRESEVFHFALGEKTNQVILTASSLISDGGNIFGEMIVGVDLDQDFITQMRDETGLEQTVLIKGQPVVTSLNIDLQHLAGISRQPVSLPILGEQSGNTFEVQGRPYYAARLPLNEPDLEVEIALDVADILETQTRLVWILASGIVGIAALGTIMGSALARRIRQPLVKLGNAAANISRGDLETPVEVEAQVHEVAMVSQPLETARGNLLRTLNDLQREKAWTDQLLESIVEGIIALDERRRITFFSHGAERITGWSRDEVLGCSCDEVFRLAGTKTPFWESLPAPGLINKIVVELADGHWASLAVTGARLSPSEAGEAETDLVFRDVSSEEIIHHLLASFIGNVAHEFRTPLSALAASVELLMDQSSELSHAEMQELLQSLHLGILGLQTLIDNLLESASIEAGRFRVNPRPYDVSKIIREAASTMQPLLDKYGQRLVLDLPATLPQVIVDPRPTVQVLVNLLANASKYGPADADITIQVNIEDSWVRVDVSDRGPGVPEEYRENLFQRFTDPGSTNADLKGGIGLGLSVVKAVVEAQGGQTGWCDRQGGGSTFWFTLLGAGRS